MSLAPSPPGSTISPFSRVRCALLLAWFSSNPLHALEDETTAVLATRLQHRFDANRYLELNLTTSFNEGFEEQERETAELRYDVRWNRLDLMLGYNLQFDRKGQPGQEHRLFQQLRHQFTLEKSTVESSVRLEERYYSNSAQAGLRLRILNRWSRPFAGTNILRLGHEWVLNLDDMSASAQGGTSQNRLLGILQHNHGVAGGRVELQYRLSYLRDPVRDASLQHQVQLLYRYDI